MSITATRGGGTAWVCGWIALMALAGCIGGSAVPEPVLDTPHHHVTSGVKLIEKRYFEDARREFESALKLDPHSSSAHRGMGWVYMLNGDFEQARAELERAKEYAATPEDRALAQVGFMRFYTLRKQKGWLGDVEKSFRAAIAEDKQLPEAYYQMGIAYKQAHQFQDAQRAFERVSGINKRLAGPAREEAQRMQIIVLAAPQSSTGKALAAVDRITRAHLAALLVEEFRLMDILGAPRRTAAEMPGANDIATQTYRDDIETVLALRLATLGPAANGKFQPDRYTTRADLAAVMAEILVRGTDEDALAKRYKDAASPFADVSEKDPSFNAIMICTYWRSLMTPRMGNFEPAGSVTGADTLLALKKLRATFDIPTPVSSRGR